MSLRPLAARDVPAIAAACVDAEIQRWTTVPEPYTRADARAYVALSRRQWRDGSAALFAVVEPASGSLLASIGLRLAEWPVAEVGYWVAPAARARGVATRAVRLAAAWALDELGAARLQLVTDVDNVASQRVAENACFRREGVLRQALVTKGRRSDCVMFSLLPGDPR